MDYCEKPPGKERSTRFCQTTVAVVGNSDSGWMIALQLASAGCGNFILIDEKQMDASNTNRFLWGREQDIGVPKVELVQRSIMAINNYASVMAIPAAVQAEITVKWLKKADAVFSCAENSNAGIFLQKFCLKHRKPLLDLRAGFAVEENVAYPPIAEVSLCVPGGACLGCMRLSEREHVSCTPLSAIAASMGMKMFMSWLARERLEFNFVQFNGLTYETTPMFIDKRDDCSLCK